MDRHQTSLFGTDRPQFFFHSKIYLVYNEVTFSVFDIPCPFDVFALAPERAKRTPRLIKMEIRPAKF